MTKSYFATAYSNPYVLYFDLMLFLISCIAQTILLSLWIYKSSFHIDKEPDISHEKAVKGSDHHNKMDSNIEIQSVSKTKQSPKPKQNSNNSTTIDIKSKLLCTACIFAATLFCYSYFSIILTGYITGDILSYQTGIYCQIGATIFIFIVIQRILLYSYYVYRIYITFKNSCYELPKKK
eukprot:317115_1